MFRVLLSSFLVSLLFINISYWFEDISNSFYRESIQNLKEKGIVNWYDDGSFWAENTITRAEILKIILWIDWDLIDSEDNNCFPDISEDKWYAKYICYAYDNEIAKWYDDWLFKPNNNVTVIEALAFIARYKEIEFEQSDLDKWYVDYIDYAHENNIISSDSYLLDTPILRWAASEMIYKFQDFLENWVSQDYSSVGCWTTPVHQIENSLTIWDRTFQYALDLPQNYDKNKSYPVIIWFHWRTNTYKQVQSYMKLTSSKNSRYSKLPEDSSNYIWIYPEWRDWEYWLLPNWESMEFYDTMIREVLDDLCVDKNRIHVVWHSMWSYFAHKVACLRWDTIRSVSSVWWPWYLSYCRWPAASLIMHNSKDALVPYSDWERAYEIRTWVNNLDVEEKSDRLMWYSCDVMSDWSLNNPTMFCSEYETYGWDPHSWPLTWSTLIYEFLSKLK